MGILMGVNKYISGAGLSMDFAQIYDLNLKTNFNQNKLLLAVNEHSRL